MRLTVDSAISICIIMGEGLPQVAILTVHVCTNCNWTVWQQEMTFDADLFIYQGTNRSSCQQRGWSVFAPPLQCTCRWKWWKKTYTCDYLGTIKWKLDKKGDTHSVRGTDNKTCGQEELGNKSLILQLLA